MDVVVPFRGAPRELEQLRARLERIELRTGDTALLVDNTPGHVSARPFGPGAVQVLRAAERATPAFARNQGAARGSADWILFLDADTLPPAGLLELLFDPPPGPDTAVLAGGVVDEEVPKGGRAAARYAYLRGVASQDWTFRFGRWSYPKTSNAAFRRSAFEQARGFREELRAGEDADLYYRLAAAGWGVERREDATVVHTSRVTARGFAAQRAVHGAGSAWLERHYPGSFPARRRPGLILWGLLVMAGGLLAAARARDRDRAIWAIFQPIDDIAFELGRSLRNERPLRRAPR